MQKAVQRLSLSFPWTCQTWFTSRHLFHLSHLPPPNPNPRSLAVGTFPANTFLLCRPTFLFFSFPFFFLVRYPRLRARMRRCCASLDDFALDLSRLSVSKQKGNSVLRELINSLTHHLRLRGKCEILLVYNTVHIQQQRRNYPKACWKTLIYTFTH